ncbi:18585_t:CDS:1, partial [Funneliformis geosporum]
SSLSQAFGLGLDLVILGNNMNVYGNDVYPELNRIIDSDTKVIMDYE